ncbi:carboxymuconolactone decarboxylase family protein [Trinickia diaoshuihuensis]|uniref:carboxymuconolactone decarboxylase family protein n=1 Tax=Trinickia diaoshuihuensis TaxID=2292265 RepID=UPI000E2576C0|nr:carboxymuconolactone decarboxylase family protein [Trinickia diaoshuihuensis]
MRDADTYQRGLERIAELDDDVDKRVERLNGIHPDLGRYVIEFGFGEILSRSGLTLQQRELSTVAALTAMGAIAQLKVHVAASLKVGLSRGEIAETIIQMAFYAGFPAALNAMNAAKEVFEQHHES